MNARRIAAVVVCLLGSIDAAWAQPRVDPRQMYERVMAVVPLVGAGTPEDPKRPLYAPLPHGRDSTSRTGILGFTYVLSDDGKSALVEFVARDRSAFQQILADAAAPGSNVQAFVKGVHKREDIEAAFKARKPNFDFDHFGVRMP
ncbi:MAG TPA: hypothetical protein VEV17_05655 [Bryobacteraceae bacterium]|nr:hypothetical protein [Bryobacteraceae bacterium]